jgi:hypothetical protein
MSRRGPLLLGMMALGLGSLLWAPAGEGASGAADGIYTVTITLLEVSKDGGSTYTTVFSGAQAINIAAVDAGAVAAGLASGAALTPGTYDRVRVTLSDTLLFKGFVNSGNATIFTNGGANAAAFTTNTNAADSPGATYAVSTFTIPPENRTNVMTVSMSVQAGTTSTCTVKFDTSGVLTSTPNLLPPVVSATIS